MSVTVDDRTLATEELGLQTVGEVLAHLQREKRLVVQVLIDGQEPDLQRMSTVRRRLLREHTLYIETADPREMALEVLEAVEEQLGEADRLKGEAGGLLGAGQHPKAMEKLSGCFGIWQNAQESLAKTAQLLKIDLSAITVDGADLTTLLGEFSTQLRQIKSALENRDFVSLGDILSYEMTRTCEQWRQAIEEMRRVIEE